MDVYCLAWFLLLVAQGAACKILIRLQAGVQVLVDGAFYGLAITQAVYTCDSLKLDYNIDITTSKHRCSLINMYFHHKRPWLKSIPKAVCVRPGKVMAELKIVNKMW